MTSKRRIRAVALLLAAGAYAILPRSWASWDLRHPQGNLAWRTRTHAGIPGDPINLHLAGDVRAIDCAFAKIGWVRPVPVGLRSSEQIARSVLRHRSDPTAPVSLLTFRGRPPTLAFEHQVGASASTRDHVRLWQQAPGDWVGAVSFDARAGVDHETLRVTHHIDPDLDAEREKLAHLLQGIGAQDRGLEPGSGVDPFARNGSGDRFATDGMIRRLDLAKVCAG
jgi:hypothetical protein